MCIRDRHLDQCRWCLAARLERRVVGDPPAHEQVERHVAAQLGDGTWVAALTELPGDAVHPLASCCDGSDSSSLVRWAAAITAPDSAHALTASAASMTS